MNVRRRLFVACTLVAIATVSTPVLAAWLNSITLSAGQLSPTFRAWTFNYTSTVPSTVASITVRAVGYGTIRINNTLTSSGVQSAPIALANGPNTIRIAVTAWGRTDTYTIVVTRLSSENNTPPSVDISSPSSGTTVNEGAAVTFTGTAADAQDAGLNGSSIGWSSSRDGALGTGASLTRALSNGSHIITASVTDSAGSTATDTVTVNVNAAPVVAITAPASGAGFTVGSSVTFSGTATDAEDGNLGSQIGWTSSIAGPLGTGASLASAALAVGNHVITAAATDSRGQTRSASINVRINAEGGTATRPNILLLVSDDVGAEASSPYPDLAGNTGAVPMPNIETLAANGLVFDNVWASPLCSPTRATILSGLYGHRNGVTNVGGLLPTSTYSLFKYIADASPSYAMGVFGKWHLAGTSSNISSVQHIVATGVPNFWGFVGGGLNNYFNWTGYDINGTPTTTTQYATTAITNAAINFIQQHQNTRPQDPWFVYVPYNAAHSPNQVPPANLHSVNIGSLQPGTTSNTVPVYKAMIQAMDTEIGRLLDGIGPVGSPQRDNTIVIYMGDNGTPSNVKDAGTGVRGSKQGVYEGGVRVPLVIAGAGVTRRGREDDLVVSTDLYATIAALTGINVSQVYNSHSLMPLFTSASASTGRTHAFTELCGSFGNRYAIRDRQFKLMINNGVWALYDLINDPLEVTNLYSNASYASVRAALNAELQTLKQSATAGCFQ